VAKTIDREVNINDRAVAAKLSQDEADRLISDFHPFIKGLASQYSRQFDGINTDDLISICMLAFYESIQSYDSEKGHFLPFARRVVRARAIDYARAQGRHRGKTVSLDSSDPEQQSTQSALIAEASEQIHDNERRLSALQEEIEQFSDELASWGITMESLTRHSPKHKKLRDSYKDVVAKVSINADIITTIVTKRYFPVSAIAKLTGLPTKKLERARIYVIASLIIKLGDYEMLSEYVDD